jgi:hypothetical protein
MLFAKEILRTRPRPAGPHMQKGVESDGAAVRVRVF